MNLLISLTAQYLIFAIILAVAVFWVTRLGQRGNRELVISGLLSLVFSFFLIKLSGALIYDPRPFVSQHFVPLIPHAADNGFPSDHTALAMVLALVVLQASRSWGIWLIMAALVVGVARVAAGVHSPLDILGAVIIAGIAVGLSRLAASWLWRQLDRKKAIS